VKSAPFGLEANIFSGKIEHGRHDQNINKSFFELLSLKDFVRRWTKEEKKTG